jgi:hypothetical protein
MLASPQQQGYVQFCANWCHEKPCRRRNAFSSWSMLGWVGSIEWQRHRHLSWQFPIILLEYKKAVQSFDNSQIRVHRVTGFEQLASQSNVSQDPQELRLTGTFYRFSIDEATTSAGTEEKGFEEVEIIVPLNDAFVNNCRVYWDEATSSLFENAGLYCLELSLHDSTGSTALLLK